MSFTISTLHLSHGARLGICPMPGRFTDVFADVTKIANWAPDLVISMTESSEMDRHGVKDLGEMLGQADIPWRHFPIRDYNTPDNMENWAPVSALAHQVLDANGSVLAHCYGGRGRAGMILLRLLIERGEPPHRALENLRAIRKGAVETDGQFEWALAGRKGNSIGI